MPGKSIGVWMEGSVGISAMLTASVASRSGWYSSGLSRITEAFRVYLRAIIPHEA
jgi:hypothetical protein